MRKGTCKHWSVPPGTGGDPRCALGHDIRVMVGGSNFGWLRRIPCIRESGLPPIDPVSCADYCEPTAEEIASYEADSMRMIDRFARGVCPSCDTALVAHSGGRRCPKCPDVYSFECRLDDDPEEG